MRPSRKPYGCRAPYTQDKSISQFQHPYHPVVEISDTTAGIFLRASSPCDKTHETYQPTHLSNPGAKTSWNRCNREPGRSGLARRPLAHLIQAVDFLRGIHHFPAAGALGIHCRGSRGRWLLLRRRLGAPRSLCDIPRRAPRHLGAGRRAPGASELAWRGARGRGGAWGRPRSATLALGSG